VNKKLVQDLKQNEYFISIPIKFQVKQRTMYID